MKPVCLLTVALAAAFFSACSEGSNQSQTGSTAATDAAGAGCVPVEDRSPNGDGQVPASPDQTRACGVSSNVAFETTVVADGLENPWAVEPLPDGSFLVTEKPGRLRVVTAAGQVGAPITGLPAVDAQRQGG